MFGLTNGTIKIWALSALLSGKLPTVLSAKPLQTGLNGYPRPRIVRPIADRLSDKNTYKKKKRGLLHHSNNPCVIFIINQVRRIF